MYIKLIKTNKLQLITHYAHYYKSIVLFHGKYIQTNNKSFNV